VPEVLGVSVEHATVGPTVDVQRRRVVSQQVRQVGAWGGCLESVTDTPRVTPDCYHPDRPAPSLGPTHGPAVFPAAIPKTVQADTLRAILKLHEAADENTCHCGLPLGEETGLCWYGRRAQRALFELTRDHRADHPDAPDV
jgi:hypothetical protein